jgi:cobalt-zinc-cadmium efflux system outer membrane protein
MFRRSGTLMFLFALVLTHAVSANAQYGPVERRTIKPIGTATNPIGLKVPTVTTTYRSTSLTEISGPIPGLPITSWITFPKFMRQVEEANLALAAQRYNVPIAEAQLTAASVYPDPTFGAGYGGDVSGNRQVTTYSGSLTQTVVLGGKIGAREQTAAATLKAANAGLSDYLRTLRGQAANAFIDGLVGILRLHREVKSLERSRQLVELNTERLRKREISEDGLMRVRVSELETHSDLFDSQSALHESLGGLAVFMGTSRNDGLVAPVGNLEGPARTFSLQELVEKAIITRGDVLAAQYALQSARTGYRLAEANRVPDLTVSGGYAHLTRVTNPIDPSPAWDGLAMFLSIPIPLSNLNKGDLQAAYYGELQAGKALQAAKLQAETDVRTAYEQYSLSVERAQLFASELLGDSDRLYKSQLFKLEKGQVTLVEVLDAHQALDQLYFDYYNALSARAKALVALEQAAGIWDVDF